MKRLFLFLTFIPCIVFGQSHASLTIFSEKGDKFFLWLDGVLQNKTPAKNLRVDQLPDLYYTAKIFFADSSIPNISKNNLYVSDADEVFADVAYRIRKERDKKQRLAFYSISPRNDAFSAPRDMMVVSYSKTAAQSVTSFKVDSVITTSGRNLGSLHVFSSNNDKFSLYLNNVKQNDQAQSSIRINDIPGLYYNARIVFENSNLTSITKNNLSVSDGDDILMHVSYRIRKDNAGKPRLNFYAMEPAQSSFTPLPGMHVYNFGRPADVIASAPPLPETRKEIKPITGSITNIRISEPYSLDQKIPASAKKIKESTATVDKLTASTSKMTASNSSSAKETAKASNSNLVAPIKKCNGWPMGKGDLVAAKKSITDAQKDDEKLKVARQSISSNCVLASQVSEFCQLFSAEKTKLAFAKYAFEFTLDRKNYPDLLKLFSQEKSKKDLKDYISNK